MSRIWAILENNKLEVLIFILLVCFLPLFFYNLGGYGLADFDEAWYGEIARNILRFHKPFLLFFNGAPYLDHPPLGFLLVAASFLIFGVNEFAARFPSAFLGWLSLVLTYLIGKNLFNRVIGLTASLILLSSVWFIFRARSGNLDATLVFFLLLTFYSAIKCKNDPSWLVALGGSLAALLMTKSFIGLVLIVPIALYFLLGKVMIYRREFLFGILVFMLLLGPWLVVSYLSYGENFFARMLYIGTRSNTIITLLPQGIFNSDTAVYLHEGIRKWYYPFLISLVGSTFFAFKDKRIIPILAVIAILLGGFLANAKTEIWHLIPLFPFIGLVIAFFVFSFCRWVLGFFTIEGKRRAANLIVLPAVFFLATFQVYQFRTEVKLTDRGLEDRAFVAKAASLRVEPLFLDASNLWPAVVFYSQKRVNLINKQVPPKNNLSGIMSYRQRPFLILTEDWHLTADKIALKDYQVLSGRGDKVLILVTSRKI